jgi:hypothetical protein
MPPTDQKTEIVSPAEVPEDLPLPSDPKVIFLGGLFALALLAAAYIASEIILPFVFAIVLKLLLQPAFRILERLHVPQIIAALLRITRPLRRLRLFRSLRRCMTTFFITPNGTRLIGPRCS